MARILVTGDHSSVAGRDALQRLTQRMRDDGHDAFVFGTQDEDFTAAVRGCDAVVGILDRIEAGGAALMAYAHAQQKPAMGLAGKGAPMHPVFAEIATVRSGDEVEAWIGHLPDFYDEIRPFAGRVVRDRIPQLVKEAGHDVTFRRLDDDEKPRFLKQKIANEAQELLRAGLGHEKEEVGDVLEALEAFILSRSFDREDLRQVKDSKRKRRGGFEQGFVVESTVRPPRKEPEPSADAPDETEHPAGQDGDQDAEVEDAATATGPGADGIDFEFDDDEPPKDDAPDNLAPERDVDARFTDI